MAIKIKNLQKLIGKSELVSDDRKKKLIKLLPTFSDKKLVEVESIVKKTQSAESNTKDLISWAVTNNETKLLEELDSYVNESMKGLRKADEAFEKAAEEENLEDFFDNA